MQSANWIIRWSLLLVTVATLTAAKSKVTGWNQFYDHHNHVNRMLPGGGVDVNVVVYTNRPNIVGGLIPYPDTRQYYTYHRRNLSVLAKCPQGLQFSGSRRKCIKKRPSRIAFMRHSRQRHPIRLCLAGTAFQSDSYICLLRQRGSESSSAEVLTVESISQRRNQNVISGKNKNKERMQADKLRTDSPIDDDSLDYTAYDAQARPQRRQDDNQDSSHKFNSETSGDLKSIATESKQTPNKDCSYEQTSSCDECDCRSSADGSSSEESREVRPREGGQSEEWVGAGRPPSIESTTTVTEIRATSKEDLASTATTYSPESRTKSGGVSLLKPITGIECGTMADITTTDSPFVAELTSETYQNDAAIRLTIMEIPSASASTTEPFSERTTIVPNRADASADDDYRPTKGLSLSPATIRTSESTKSPLNGLLGAGPSDLFTESTIRIPGNSQLDGFEQLDYTFSTQSSPTSTLWNVARNTNSDNGLGEAGITDKFTEQTTIVYHEIDIGNYPHIATTSEPVPWADASDSAAIHSTTSNRTTSITEEFLDLNGAHSDIVTSSSSHSVSGEQEAIVAGLPTVTDQFTEVTPSGSGEFYREPLGIAGWMTNLEVSTKHADPGGSGM